MLDKTKQTVLEFIDTELKNIYNDQRFQAPTDIQANLPLAFVQENMRGSVNILLKLKEAMEANK